MRRQYYLRIVWVSNVQQHWCGDRRYNVEKVITVAHYIYYTWWMFLYVKPLPFRNIIQLSRYIGSVSTTRPPTSDSTNDAIKRVRWVVLPHPSYVIGPEKHRLPAQMTGYCDRLSASGWRGSREILAYRGLYYLRFSLFWDYTQLRVVVSYGRLGTNYLFHLQRSTDCSTLEEGIDRLSRNVCNKLLLCAA